MAYGHRGHGKKKGTCKFGRRKIGRIGKNGRACLKHKRARK